MDEAAARRELAEVCRLAYARRLVSGTEGNFSIRLNDRLVLSTPSSTNKGRIQADDLLLTDMNGDHVSLQSDKDFGSRSGMCRPKVSTEFKMHLTAYHLRPDVMAVAHAHPTVAVGFTVAGVSLAKCVLPEVVCTLGAVHTAPYATPSTEDVAASIAEIIKHNDALMLDHHGALTVGVDIWDAFHKMETLEQHAKVMLVARLLGGVKPLDASQVNRLLDIRAVYGLEKLLDRELLTSDEMCKQDSEMPM